MASSSRGNSLAGSRLTAILLRHGALGFRVEGPDGIDLRVEEIDAQGQRAAHREEIEQRPAHGKFAVLHDLGDAAVTGAVEPGAHRIEVEPLPAAQDEASAGRESRGAAGAAAGW